DFNGDGSADLIVTEYGTSSVRTLLAIETPPEPSGQPCNQDAQCASLHCVDHVCCDASSCPSGERCDIFQQEGSCAPPKDVGQECQRNMDCLEGLLCLLDPIVNGFLCSPPPTPTPTLIVFPTETPSPEPTIIINRGCTGDCNNDGSVMINELLIMINIALG